MLTRLAEHRGDYDVTTVDLAALDAAPDGASVGEWAREGVAWTVGNGLMGGAPGGRLSPQEVTSRAEAAKMLMVYLKGEGLELSEHDRVWVDGRVHTNLPSWKCTSCGATSAEGKDAIAHWDTCPSNAGETVWISESWTGKQWIDLAEAPEDQCAWARRIIEKYGMLEGWYDWVWV